MRARFAIHVRGVNLILRIVVGVEPSPRAVPPGPLPSIDSKGAHTGGGFTKHQAWFDTLADLDAKASTLQQARGWRAYPYFMFARYPHLRPAGDDKAYQHTLKAWESRLASHPEAKRALEQLDRALTEQLTALIVDVVSDLEVYKRKTSRPPKTFKTEMQRRNRMLKCKRERARRMLEDLFVYAASLDPLQAGDNAEAAKRCLKILDHVRDYDYASILEAPAVHPVSKDPTVRAMIDLYWFFRSGCQLPGDEAEVRVALLRNAFWTEIGISRIEYLSKYRTGESKGCSAVHEAVRRFRPL